MDYREAREKMVDCQVRTVDVTDHAVLSAMLEVPRERFVPRGKVPLAYIDQAFDLAEIGATGRYLMTPAQIGCLLQAANLKADDVVLVIGSATGYTSALLSRLGSSIIAVEDHRELAERSRVTLRENGYDNVTVLEGSLVEGCAREAPFDLVFIEGAVDAVPQGLFDQLADRGKLIAVVGHGNAGKAILHEMAGGVLSEAMIMNCAAKPLAGFEKKTTFSL